MGALVGVGALEVGVGGTGVDVGYDRKLDIDEFLMIIKESPSDKKNIFVFGIENSEFFATILYGNGGRKDMLYNLSNYGDINSLREKLNELQEANN